MSWLDNENNRTQVTDGWLCDIPECIRRDANNRAPFMDVKFSAPATPVHPALPFPWEKPTP